MNRFSRLSASHDNSDRGDNHDYHYDDDDVANSKNDEFKQNNQEMDNDDDSGEEESDQDEQEQDGDQMKIMTIPMNIFPTLSPELAISKASLRASLSPERNRLSFLQETDEEDECSESDSSDNDDQDHQDHQDHHDNVGSVPAQHNQDHDYNHNVHVDDDNESGVYSEYSNDSRCGPKTESSASMASMIASVNRTGDIRSRPYQESPNIFPSQDNNIQFTNVKTNANFNTINSMINKSLENSTKSRRGRSNSERRSALSSFRSLTRSVSTRGRRISAKQSLGLGVGGFSRSKKREERHDYLLSYLNPLDQVSGGVDSLLTDVPDPVSTSAAPKLVLSRKSSGRERDSSRSATTPTSVKDVIMPRRARSTSHETRTLQGGTSPAPRKTRTDGKHQKHEKNSNNRKSTSKKSINPVPAMNVSNAPTVAHLKKKDSNNITGATIASLPSGECRARKSRRRTSNERTTTSKSSSASRVSITKMAMTTSAADASRRTRREDQQQTLAPIGKLEHHPKSDPGRMSTTKSHSSNILTGKLEHRPCSDPGQAPVSTLPSRYSDGASNNNNTDSTRQRENHRQVAGHQDQSFITAANTTSSNAGAFAYSREQEIRERVVTRILGRDEATKREYELVEQERGSLKTSKEFRRVKYQQSDVYQSQEGNKNTGAISPRSFTFLNYTESKNKLHSNGRPISSASLNRDRPAYGTRSIPDNPTSNSSLPKLQTRTSQGSTKSKDSCSNKTSTFSYCHSHSSSSGNSTTISSMAKINCAICRKRLYSGEFIQFCNLHFCKTLDDDRTRGTCFKCVFCRRPLDDLLIKKEDGVANDGGDSHSDVDVLKWTKVTSNARGSIIQCGKCTMGLAFPIASGNNDMPHDNSENSCVSELVVRRVEEMGDTNRRGRLGFRKNRVHYFRSQSAPYRVQDPFVDQPFNAGSNNRRNSSNDHNDNATTSNDVEKQSLLQKLHTLRLQNKSLTEQNTILDLKNKHLTIAIAELSTVVSSSKSTEAELIQQVASFMAHTKALTIEYQRLVDVLTQKEVELASLQHVQGLNVRYNDAAACCDTEVESSLFEEENGEYTSLNRFGFGEDQFICKEILQMDSNGTDYPHLSSEYPTMPATYQDQSGSEHRNFYARSA